MATDERDAVDPSNESAIGGGVDIAVDDHQEVDAQRDDDAASGAAPFPSRPKQTVGFGRYLRRRPALRVAAAHARKGLTSDERTLFQASIRAKSA